jgi:hypothetical protein
VLHEVATIEANLAGAGQLLADARTGSLLVGAARKSALGHVFGVAPDDQSRLVTVLLIGALAAVAGEYAARVPHPGLPSGVDTAMGGAVLSTALTGIAGAPSRHLPLAGALIGLAVAAHQFRPAAASVVHSARRGRDAAATLARHYWPGGVDRAAAA